jgi:hypothetical protein
MSRPENANYFRGADNSERVRQWRHDHPGYWRKKKPAGKDALQETCLAQEPVQESVTQIGARMRYKTSAFYNPLCWWDLSPW